MTTETILPAIKRIDILGVKVTPLRFAELQEHIDATIAHRRKTLVFYVNAHILNLTWTAPELREILNQAEIVFCDGFGIRWVARILGKHIPERYTPPDWLQWAGPNWATHKYRIFWVGAQPGVAEQAAMRYEAAFPGVETAGAFHGFFQKQGAESDALVAAINQSKPHIVIVGFGVPLQERWIIENFDHINTFVFIPVGAAIDYLAGTVQRGPQLMTDHSLEWLSRLIVEPKRLWRRYLIGLPQLFARVLLFRFLGRGPQG